MGELYKNISTLCAKREISIGKMCNDLGISRGNLTELKMGRIKSLKTENLAKIAGYFGVTVDHLLGVEMDDETNVTPDDAALKFALFGGDADQISDVAYDEVKRFAAYVAQREKEKKG